MKTILGLDLGTNSIGWALVQQDFENKQGEILGMGSRIIPMSQDILGEFGKGNSVSQTAERTGYRGVRRLRERYLLRRERLHRVLNVLGFLPKHYANQIDFEKHLGQFKDETEPKLVYDNKMFIFKKSFEEFLNDFRKPQPQLLENDKKIPYDWTIYYLRKKALIQKIEKEELAWILLNFNQKRGYFQLRGAEEEFSEDDSAEVLSLIVQNVVKGEKDKKYNKYWYTIDLEGGYNYQATFYGDISGWVGTIRDFVITKETLKDGTTKFRISSLPTLEEIDRLDKKAQNKLYGKIKIKTENEIDKSGKTLGAYIYDTLLQNPRQKIKGKLVRTVERKFYKDELKQILQKQKEFHPELQNEDLYNDCVRELYRNNEAHQLLLSKRDFVHLFVDDIIFYQRSLKSQKSFIGNCSFEYRKYKVNGEEKTEYLKAIPKSNPLYQEFRLWQWIYNLSIYKKDDDSNVTGEFLNNIEAHEKIFEFLNDRKEIEQKPLIKYFIEQNGLKGKTLNAEVEKYRWNFVEDKKYPCNETRTLIATRLAKVENVPNNFLTADTEQQLWHIIYSVTDKTEYEKALKTYAEKHGLEVNSFVDIFKKFPPFKSEYGSFSAKAIKKLLPLMRIGKYWNWNVIDEKTKYRISKIITNEFDEEIKNRVREKAIHLEKESSFQGLQLWLACYIVYDRHSEVALADKWNSVTDLEKYIKEFRPHSLRNPIVEQVITETLRVVKDIWQQYGNGAKDFFDEIHIELGREMKNTAEERKRMTNQITENENTNLRIKALLAELKNDTSIENVRPYSPIQQEILKIYEDGVLSSNIEIDDDILKISKTAQPTSAELKRYKLWLEQKYRSPYTGEMIPLNKLFTSEYEIEHIIPQSRYSDDSFNNKVICEAAVNKIKDNQLGLEFIRNHHGEIVETGFGKKVKVFTEDEYKDFVKHHYEKNRSKRNKLLMYDIPEKMIERQINDTRYISKFISSVLSNIIRADKDDDGVNSQNLIPGNGKITAMLKQDWGLNDIWNDLILPRFERMNQLTNSSTFTAYNEKYQKYLPTVPLELSKNFQKKRIDHRHHSLDALIIACATRNHVNYLNNQYALDKKKNKEEKQKFRFDLRAILCDKKYNDDSEENYRWVFKKPWYNFTVDARNSLKTIIVSFKQNLRVINKASNKYESYKDENGNLRIGKDGKPIKDIVSQIKGDSWAIRKSMHKETVSGKVELKRIKIPNGKILTATRKSIDATFDLKTIRSITDTGIQKILTNYLSSKGNISELAFSPEGIEDMNKNIEKYNDGISHQSIHKVRIFELGNKFPLGETESKKTKYVEAAKGTNLFFAVYENEDGNRNYETIPLNEVIEHQKWRATLSKEERKSIPIIPVKAEKGKFIFSLSPNELVYVPNEDERENFSGVDFSNLTKEQIDNIYKVVSFTGNQCFFVKHEVATSIVNKVEFSTLNKMEKGVSEAMIKECCVKLNVDRLGNIKPVIGNQ